MIKPERLRVEDKVAIVSLSSGILGDSWALHKYHLGKRRCYEIFGIYAVAMKNSLKGSQYLFDNPEERAKDLMNAFKDDSVKAIISAIGGNDTYKLLPYIDFDVIRQNPKIFMGFSDTTINHFMMYKAGLVSYYGPCFMCNFAEYHDMFQYEKDAVKHMLFNVNDKYSIEPSLKWTDDFIDWDLNNISLQKKMKPDTKGYEVLQGKGKVCGKLLGGCLESMSTMIGYVDEEWYEGDVESGKGIKEIIDKYDLFPSKDEWKGKILFFETSDAYPKPKCVENILNEFVKYGIIENVNGIIVGKPKDEKYYEEYKTVIKDVISRVNPELPILYNVNFGHASPITIIPYGIECELDCEQRTITLLEPTVL